MSLVNKWKESLIRVEKIQSHGLRTMLEMRPRSPTTVLSAKFSKLLLRNLPRPHQTLRSKG